MLLLLDRDREPICEILDYLSVTASIRFSSPGQIEMTISETSELANIIKELMYVYITEEKALFLIDFVERDKTGSDSKPVVVKGITIEGFLDQRIVFKSKLLEGANLQASIKELMIENAINPEDPTRKIDFYRFVDSTDPHVLAVNVKGLVSGISVMQAITSLLESKNLGYKVTYDTNTKLVSFEIVAGRNLCDGFTSMLHGTNLVNTVTVSVQSETLNDIRSMTDLAPYKTRVYVQNFDDMKVFNRGTSKEGIELREGYISSGHGLGVDGWELPELPPPPEYKIPPPAFPPEIPIETPLPEMRLLGLYILTDKNRLLACAFYPGLPVPDVWTDITPEGNPEIRSYPTEIVLGTGELIFMSYDYKKIYRAQMIGGWLGTRTFNQAECFFDATNFDCAPENPGGGSTQEQRDGNFVAALGVDRLTGDIIVTVTGLSVSWENYSYYDHRIFKGTSYGLTMLPGIYRIPIAYPSYGGDRPVMTVQDGVIIQSGMGWAFITSSICILEGTKWENKSEMYGGTMSTSHRSWHVRPDLVSDTVFLGNGESETAGSWARSKDLLESVITDGWDPPAGSYKTLSFLPDGTKVINSYSSDRVILSTINPSIFRDSTVSIIFAPKDPNQFLRQAVFSGYEEGTGNVLWGLLKSGGGWDVNAEDIPGYYVTSKDDMTEQVNMTPGLKTFLKEGPWGIGANGKLVEFPMHVWPILG